MEQNKRMWWMKFVVAKALSLYQYNIVCDTCTLTWAQFQRAAKSNLSKNKTAYQNKATSQTTMLHVKMCDWYHAKFC